MHRAQGRIAIFVALGDDPEPIDVRKPREPDFLGFHLAPHRMGFLRASDHFGVSDPGLVQLAFDVGGDLLDHIARFALQRDEPADDRVPALGVQHPEGQILQFVAHPLHAHRPASGA